MVKHIVRGFFSLPTIQRYYPETSINQLFSIAHDCCQLYVVMVVYSMEKRWLCGTILLFL